MDIIPLHKYLFNIWQSWKSLEVHILSTANLIFFYSLLNSYVIYNWSIGGIFPRFLLSSFFNFKLSALFIPSNLVPKDCFFHEIKGARRTITTWSIWTSLDSEPYQITCRVGAFFYQIPDIKFWTCGLALNKFMFLQASNFILECTDMFINSKLKSIKRCIVFCNCHGSFILVNKLVK